MIPKGMQNFLNQQINKEMYSGYYYLSMSAHFQSANLPGFAHWMMIQYREETEHAMKLMKHIHERGGNVILEAIEKPPSDFGSPLDVMKLVLEHEKKVSASINKCYEAALGEKDYPAQIMLEWFIKEQVEEEKSASEIVEQLKMMGEHAPSLIMIDRHLGSR